MYNLLGFLVRTFPNLNIETSRLIAWGAIFISILILCVFWWNQGEQINIKHIGIAVILGTLTSPHLNLHGLSYLLLPLLSIITILYSGNNKALALILIPLISTVLLLILFFIPIWSFSVYYLLMFAILFILSWSIQCLGNRVAF